jgi:predicted nucleic acid-binding protein
LIALDTNILIYADTAKDPLGRHTDAVSLIEKLSAAGNCCIPIQVLGEFLNVCRNKNVLNLELAADRVESYAEVFEAPPTRVEDVMVANLLLRDFNLQFFDALIITVAVRAGAAMLLSEDMQDGLEVGGLRVVNPFAAANADLLTDYLASAL